MTTATPDNVATLSRVMHVPARYLFLAHSRPEHLMRWLGPVTYPVTYCEADFRVGGIWRMQMTGPDGVKGPFFGGSYLAIEPDRRIAYTNGFEEPHGGAMNLTHDGRMIIDTTLTEADGVTTLTSTITYANAAMKAEYLAMGMIEGMNEGLDQLAGVAAELARTTA